MNYEKLTVERFEARLKNGDYKGLTGARRAIGKTDWSKKDKERAHELADKHFASGGASSVKKAASKKAAAAPKAQAKKASAAPKKAATKKAAAAKPRAETKPAPVPKRAPTTSRSAPVSTQAVPPAPPILEEVTRQNSASAVISSFRNSGPLNPLEQRAYDIATAEYAENASRAAKRVVDTAARGIPTPSPLPKKGGGEGGGEEDDAPAVGALTSPTESVVAPAGAAPRIPVTNGVEPEVELTPEEQEQLKRLERGAGAVPAVIGHG